MMISDDPDKIDPEQEKKIFVLDEERLLPRYPQISDPTKALSELESLANSSVRTRKETAIYFQKTTRINEATFDALDQLISGKLTWLADPLPIATKFKLRLRRFFRVKKKNPSTLDFETIEKILQHIRIETGVQLDAWEQIINNELTWLAEPLPIGSRLKLKIRRSLKRARKIILKIKQKADLIRERNDPDGQKSEVAVNRKEDPDSPEQP